MKVDRWEELLQGVKDADQVCRSYSMLINTVAEYKRWEKQSSQMEKSCRVEEQIRQALLEMRVERKVEREDYDQRDFFHKFSSTYTEDMDFNRKRVAGTCEWFLEDARFRSWRDAKISRLLWVSAGPGCGKSVLSKSLVDERLVSTSVMASTVCYFFFKHGQVGRQTAANALTAILHQLFAQNLETDLVKYALPRFKIHGKSLCGMFGELWKILTDTVKDPASGEVICVIDALDECEKKDRQSLMDTLVHFYKDMDLTNKADVRLKFLVTSRSYDDIENDFYPLSNVINFVRFDGDDKSDQINREINLVIDHDVPLIAHKLEPEDQQAVATHLKTMENRTYLWLYLISDVIKQKTSSHGTKRKIKALIDELPDSVNAAYEEILSRSSDRELAKKLLEIIVASKRPLTVSEINVALGLATEEGCTSYTDLDLEPDSSFKTSLKNVCGLFVAVHDSKVYLIHQTAREFLLSQPGKAKKTSADWQYSLDLYEANFTLAQICVTLLAFDEFQATMPGRVFHWWKRKREFPEVKRYKFLSYSASQWVEHYRLIQDHSQVGLIERVLELCDTQSARFRTWYPLYCYLNSLNEWYGESNLTLAAVLGLHQIVLLLLDRDADINAPDRKYGNALQAASAKGHKEVVQTLLEKGADVHAQGGKYDNALQAASARGYKEVVQILLEKGADVNKQGGKYDNALQAASARGYKEIVQMLLEKRADIYTQGGNALQTASAGGQTEVVQILLENGADVHAQGGKYDNALQAASVEGHEEVVQILLKNEADVNTQGGRYGNALQAASAKGHEDVVQTLLEKGADVHAQGGRYGNALQAASAKGHEDVVQTLLEKGADVHAQGGKYDNALQAASVEGHDKVVQILLDCGAKHEDTLVETSDNQ